MPEPALSRDAIVEQIERLCQNEILAPKQAALLRFLDEAPNFQGYEQLAPPDLLLMFEVKEYRLKKGVSVEAASAAIEKKRNKALSRARQMVSSLSVSLRLYYCELPPNAVDRVLIQIEPPSRAEEHRYRPRFSRFVPRAPRTRGPQVIPVGTSVDALDYVTEQIPHLKAIQETFIRWIDRDSLYAGSNERAFTAFLKALKDNPVLYRAVLGPLTDSIVHVDGGLRDVLANRIIENLPDHEEGARVYRLLHGTAMLNFTLLFRFRDRSDRYAYTEDIEVLFGFGIHEKSERPSETKVFRTKDPDIVREFYEVFKMLRTSEFSRELDLNRPDVFKPEPRISDVMASWEKLPTEEILRKISASGAGEASSGYHPQIKICVSALEMLAGRSFTRAIKAALKRGVAVSIALWAPGKFTEQRTSVSGIAPDEAKKEMDAARAAVESLGPNEKLSTPQCTREAGSVSIFWIDDLIYFAPYWLGKDVAEGPHFLVAAASQTGRELQEQWSQMV